MTLYPSPDVYRPGGVVAKALSLRPDHLDVPPFVPEGRYVIVSHDETDFSTVLRVVETIHVGFQPKRRGADCKFPRLSPRGML